MALEEPPCHRAPAPADGTYALQICLCDRGPIQLMPSRTQCVLQCQCPHCIVPPRGRLTRPDCRSAMSPYKLVSTFDAPDDHVHTLYDNWETSVSRYPHVRPPPLPLLMRTSRRVSGHEGGMPSHPASKWAGMRNGARCF